MSRASDSLGDLIEGISKHEVSRIQQLTVEVDRVVVEMETLVGVGMLRQLQAELTSV